MGFSFFLHWHLLPFLARWTGQLGRRVGLWLSASSCLPGTQWRSREWTRGDLPWLCFSGAAWDNIALPPCQGCGSLPAGHLQYSGWAVGSGWSRRGWLWTRSEGEGGLPGSNGFLKCLAFTSSGPQVCTGRIWLFWVFLFVFIFIWKWIILL